MSAFNALTHTRVSVCRCVFGGISVCCIIATPQDALMDSETMKRPVCPSVRPSDWLSVCLTDCLSVRPSHNLSISSSLSCVSQAEEALASSLRTHSAPTHPVAVFQSPLGGNVQICVHVPSPANVNVQTVLQESFVRGTFQSPPRGNDTGHVRNHLPPKVRTSHPIGEGFLCIMRSNEVELKVKVKVRRTGTGSSAASSRFCVVISVLHVVVCQK